MSGWAVLMRDLANRGHKLYWRKHGDGGTEMDFGMAVASVAYRAGLAAGKMAAQRKPGPTGRPR